jgi:4-amino-4-deoxy-L-arabinose transferase-like glycosyltransferase
MNQSLVIHSHKIQRFFLIIALLTLIGYGFFLRINSLGTPSLWIDEGYSINAVNSILEKGYPQLDSGKFYGGGLLNNYLIALSTKIFGFDALNPWPTRLPSVIFGTGVILLIYFLVKKMLNNKTLAFCSSFIIAFSSWEIAWSRQARGYIAAQFFILLTLYFLWQWLETKKIKKLIFLLLSFIAAYFSHAIAISFAPALIIAFLAYQILHPQNRLPKKYFILAISVMALVAVLLIVLILINSKIVIYNFSAAYLNYLFKDLKIFTWLVMAGFIWGIFDKKNFWPIIFISISTLFPLMIIAFYSQAVQIRYLFSIFPLLIVLAIYFIHSLIQKIPSLSKFPIWQSIIALTMVILAFSSHLNFSLKEFYPLEWDSPQPNFKEAYSIIRQNRQENDIIISPYTPLNEIYLGDKGLWLAISLTGKSEEIANNIINGNDYYTAAPVIENSDQLLNLIENQKGFIVIDGMASIRLQMQMGGAIHHPKIKEVYTSGSGLDKIWVYKF